MTRKLIIAGMAGLMLTTSAWAQSAPLSKDDYVRGILGDEAAAGDAAAPAGDAATADPAKPAPRQGRTRGFTSLTPRPAPTPSPANVSPMRKPAASVGAAKPAAIAPAAKAKPAVAASRKMAGAPNTGRMFDIRMNFDLNSANLTQDSRAQATALAEALKDKRMAGKTFLIGGHTDSSGSAAYNRQLSKERADAVADFLVSQGVDRAMLRTYGFGYAQPLEGTSPAAAENRRVEAGLIL
ncbi:OmpA family protein [Novosphingobium aquimarinum]|uniref:OmpA family protein n=1 Tax=Novosphingobium aquimarinum TaxID=2682494 RepID=UPI0012EC8763|nr:OmpA family protein [Novosphingobium aquimarinum]